MSTTITVQQVSKVYTEADMPRRTLGSILGFSLFGTKDTQQAATDDGPPRFQALDRVSFTVNSGETLAVLGPSGCGKTTLLRILAGLMAPSEGQVLYDSIPVQNIPLAERGIGMVFQDYALYPHMVGWDNVGLFLKLRKRDAEVPPRVREISKTMHIALEPILGRMPPKMSGGEKQRVAIARCLARDPRVFFFDEPFANLDAKFRSDTRIELKRLLRRYQVTSVYVTHDQSEAIALADRIAIMRDGQVVQIGTFRQLYDTPLNLFVASFFSSPSMNLFRGRIQDGYWRSPMFSWGPIRPGLPNDAAVVLGIRPEHLVPRDGGEITALVEQVEPHFAERIQVVYAQINGARIVVQLPDALQVQRGSTITLSPQPEQVMLFDAQTELRIG